MVFTLFAIFFPPPAAPEPQTEAPVVVVIHSPVDGQALQGSIPVIGTIGTSSFTGGRLLFSYEGDDRGSWFEITRIPFPSQESELGVWDTTSLTDGNYALQLEVTLGTGEVITHTVSGLRIRNYSAIETDTPAPTATLAPEAGPTREPPPPPTHTQTPPTPTPLPPNPGEITLAQLSSSLARGALIALAFFALLGFLVLRRRFK